MRNKSMTDNRHNRCDTDRREFLISSLFAAAQLAGFKGSAARALTGSETKIVAEQSWGRIEEIGDGVWAIVSTPWVERDFTTICNGGIVAGDQRVLIVESFGSPDGAGWVSSQAQELTGRRPTDVVLTHFHGDHANGVEGLASDAFAPTIWRTEKTLELIEDADRDRDIEARQTREQMLAEGNTIGVSDSTTLDLGGRLVEIHPRAGHTPSDVTVELVEPAVTFCGDLVWNQFFPNYRDTLPTEFAKSLRDLRRDDSTLYVGGHGPISDLSAVDLLIDLVDDIGEFAVGAHAKGLDAAAAAAQYKLPEATASWTLFNPSYFEVAIKAWYRELG